MKSHSHRIRAGRIAYPVVLTVIMTAWAIHVHAAPVNDVTVRPTFSDDGFYSETIDTVSGFTPATEKALLKIAPATQPRVGLVLSGGGAKGIAHIGVIKALEENDIPVDCIAGTSMGAVVGSLYSIGYSPDEMMRFVTSDLFLNCSTGTIDRDSVYYFSESAPTSEWLTLNLDLKNETSGIAGQIIPSSLISPLPMNIEFLNLFTPYTRQCGQDFNNLFVPFRCVCSDVYNKHKVVLGSGSLGNAVRASMSFPTVFRPIEINGLLMYDGGIYDNFPVDVMEKEFEPDFIIGVSVSGPDGKPQPGNLMNQLEDMIIQSNNYSLPPEKGVKIQVPVLNFGVLDFPQAKVIYDIGYSTGLAMVDSIKRRLATRRPLAEVQHRRARFASEKPTVTFDSVAVTGAKAAQARYLKFLFTKGLSDRPFGLEQTVTEYYRAISGGKLSNLLPFAILDKPKHGENTLLLQATVKNPWSIGVGGWITTSPQSMLYLRLGYHTLSYNSLAVDLSGWLGQSYYAGMLSAMFTIHTQRPSRMLFEGVMSKRRYYDSQIMFYQDQSPTFLSETENYVKLSYCLASGRKSVAKASLGYAYNSNKFLVSEANTPEARHDVARYRDWAVQLAWEYNTLDNMMYPMGGRQLLVTATGEHEQRQYVPRGDKKNADPFKTHLKASVEVIWQDYFRVHKNFVIGAMARGLATFGNVGGEYLAAKIHEAEFAPTPSLLNYYNPAFRADNYAAAGVMPIWNPISKLQLRGEFYGYMPIRDIEQKPDGMAVHSGWFKKPQFIGQLSAVYNFSFASLTLYGNYLSSPAKNWNFGLSFGLFFQAPRFIR